MPRATGVELDEGTFLVSTAGLRGLMLDGRSVGLSEAVARAAFEPVADEIEDKVVRFVLGDGSILLLPEEG